MKPPTTTTASREQRRVVDGDGKFHFSIDRGGTFTDVHSTEGIRRVLDERDPSGERGRHPRGKKVDTSLIGSIRMGTTVATNALLEREGERMGLVITRGFGDLLRIGDQTRSDM